jgi:ATP-binding cassette subfamily B protein RaxB
MKLPEELTFSTSKVLPVVRAVEAAECGLACMVMIANYYGHRVDLNGMRQRFPISMAGANLRSLGNLAEALGLATRPLRLELDALRNLKLPAILHWDLNHFVVLRQIRNSVATIHDPARGAVRIPMNVLSLHFTGVALEVTPLEKFEVVESRAPVRLSDLWGSIRGASEPFFRIVLLSLALQAVIFVIPLQVQIILDQGVSHGDLDLLKIVAIGFGLLVLLQGVISAVRDWSIQVIANQLTLQVTGNLVHHLLRLPSSYFEHRHIGDVLSRVSSARSIQDSLSQGLVSVIIDGLMSIVAGGIMFFYAPLLGVLVVGSVALIFLSNMLTYAAVRERTEDSILTVAAEQSQLMESIRAIVTVKLLGGEVEREARWKGVFSRSLNANIALNRIQIFLSLFQSVVLGLQNVLVIYFGAHLIIEGKGFSIGMLTAFLSYKQTFTDRTAALVNRVVQFRTLGLHLQRLGDIIATPTEYKSEDAVQRKFSGSFEFSAVSFRYSPADKWILRNVNLSVKPGDFVAVVGPSGGGKSTMLKLMLGLATPAEGAIRIDGETARPDLWRQWRSQVGVVSQDDQLLSGSLADNISFFDPEMDLNKVHMAATAAQIHGEIMKMPMNYATLVGDMGSALSAGQRQRVLLARALYRRPKILFLDEGTANLDEENELAISALIAELPITRIAISHRPALISGADRILRVEDEKVVELQTSNAESGSHIFSLS